MSESRNHLRSVSDLYAADEIEVLLLEEIRDLDPPPTAYSRPEDIQDFEIGSRTGGAISSHSSELDSPGVHSTVHSWDSHANYHGHYGHDNRHGSSHGMSWSRATHFVLYCDIQTHLKTSTGFVRLLLLITSIACLATLCSSGTTNVSLFMLPLVGRLRFMIFVAVFCLLITTLLLFLDISHVVYMLPLNWPKLNFWIFSGIGVSYIASCSLLGLSIWEYSGIGWVPRRIRSQLTAAAGLALSCALISFLLSWLHGRDEIIFKSRKSLNNSKNQLYKPVGNSSSSGLTTKDKNNKKSSSSTSSWVVKNSKKKRNQHDDDDDDDDNTNKKLKGNGNINKYKPINKKDHWASAREHFLPIQDDDETQITIQRDDNVDIEHKKRRKKRDDITNVTNGNGIAGRKLVDASTRKVPQKLSLKTIERPQSRKTSTVVKQQQEKTSRTSTNSDLQNYVAETVRAWELETGNTDPARAENLRASLLEASRWSGLRQKQQHQQQQQQQHQPDDVQPCSSKTVDPYTFA
ncbi:uncharacterized protein LOC122850266 isoform X2 [Aphidius gifuensis]|uniref:uncharacterized protein LOC122850266 isoform X2 n=1 Tax=Aphidius gifuensis TaxID=684658 RepID=UPI001CDC62B9|nr:uncharacterized protein LOC122850266 isoform X2 [Aphidius gifuensis]